METGVALEVSRWPLSEAAGAFVDASIADSTRTAYTADWQVFRRWCELQGADPLPAEPVVVANFVAEQAGLYKPATLDRRVAAVNKVHSLAGHTPPGSHPAVRAVLAGIRREHGTRVRRMAPIMLDDLRRVLGAFDTARYPAAVASRRDRCLLLFGFAGAFRRSELAALNLGDVTIRPADGLHVVVLRSKTDQEGAGQVKGLPYGRSPLTCPVCAFTDWVQFLLDPDRVAVLRGIRNRGDGHSCRGDALDPQRLHEARDLPLFAPVDRRGEIGLGDRISGQAINEAVRRRLGKAGIGPAGYGAHSLRAGFVTEALRQGATEHAVMRQTWQKSPATVAIYDREQLPLKGNAVTRIGL